MYGCCFNGFVRSYTFFRNVCFYIQPSLYTSSISCIMKVYSNAELDGICTGFIAHLYINYGESDIYWFFKLLYATGARYSDMIGFFDWQITATNFLYIGIKNKRPAVVPFSVCDFDILTFYNTYNSLLNLNITYSVLLG